MSVFLHVYYIKVIKSKASKEKMIKSKEQIKKSFFPIIFGASSLFYRLEVDTHIKYLFCKSTITFKLNQANLVQKQNNFYPNFTKLAPT